MTTLKYCPNTASHCNSLQPTATLRNSNLYMTVQQSQDGDPSLKKHTLLHTAARCSARKHTAAHYSTLQHTAAHCSTLQHTAAHCSTLRLTAAHYYALQYATTHCNTLQRTVTHRNSNRKMIDPSTVIHCKNTLQHTAVHCNILQHTATQFNTLHPTETAIARWSTPR